MSKLESYRYYGTSDPMSGKEAYQCDRYVKRQKANLYVYGRYLLDMPALMRPFHLDCWQCRKAHRETCCENGQPYAVADWQKPILDAAAGEIVERYFPQQAKESVVRHGIWDTFNTVGSLRSQHGNCVFFKEINGRNCCAIHAFAESDGKDVYQLKPFSCMLYPLELIEMGDTLLITALTDETAHFSRWGFDYLEQFYCASLDRRKLAKHLDHSLFSLEGYRPAYEWNEFIIHQAFGVDVVNTIRTLAEQMQMDEDDRIPM
ncbi:DUF3109 family protein [Brevibacillus fluminis]|uniref:DUF3109 family protein n=1 Tax=Brevibacillus fluminis TaxID=511487 RepID=A0A3M8DBT2_9BACL|nr:DUF3109 family protein [Brevibacillus fluminis]RNB85079.1 DUF3109 family protein [Brevibacillus fluminis]